MLVYLYSELAQNLTINKNKMHQLEKKHFKNTASIFIISILALLHCIGCNSQIDKAKKTQPQSNVTSNARDTLKDTVKIAEPNLLLNTENSANLNQYKAGKKEGKWKTSYPTGQLKTEGNYKNGLKEGLHKEWAADGILLLEGFYEKGKANGLMKWYHEKGHLAGEGKMKDGIRFGTWIICDVEENGFCIEAHFKAGKRDGIWKINHENARDKLWKEQTWKDDKVVSEKCWDEKGNVIECK